MCCSPVSQSGRRLKPGASGLRGEAACANPRWPWLAAIMKATGWQSHSVCGFLAGWCAKSLGLTLASEKTGEERIYRVAAKGKAAKRKE